MTQQVHFREGVSGDRDAILALRELVFREEDRDKQQADFWEWEFKRGYAGAGRIFVAESGDRIVGHFAFVPQRYVSARETMRGALAVDLMTHPEFRRQRVFSRLASFALEQLRSDFQIITALPIRPPVVDGLLAGGWRSALQIPVLLKPLSLFRIAQDFVGLRAGAEERSEPATESVVDSIRPIREADFEQIDALLATHNIRQNRSLEFLQWRYRQNPRWQHKLDGFFEGDRLRAFMIHRDTILRGLRSRAIADVGVFPGSEESLRQLVVHVCGRGRGGDRGLAAAFISRHHPAYHALRKSGFVPGPHRFRLMLQVFDETLGWIVEAPWSLSWGDTDHL